MSEAEKLKPNQKKEEASYVDHGNKHYKRKDQAFNDRLEVGEEEEEEEAWEYKDWEGFHAQ